MLVSYSTCPHIEYDMPSEHQFAVIDDTLIDISCGCFFWFFAKRVLFLEALKLIFLFVFVFFSIWNKIAKFC